MGHVAEQPLQLLLGRVHLQDLLPFLGGQADVVGDVVRKVQRLVDGTGGAGQLGRQVGRERDELLERRDRPAHESLALDGDLLVLFLGKGDHAAPEVLVVARHRRDAHAPQPQHGQLHCSVGELQHVLDPHHSSNVVQVVEPDLFRGLVELGGDRDVALPTRQVLEQLQRAAAPDREWDEDAREHHRRLQRQHRQLARKLELAAVVGGFVAHAYHLSRRRRPNRPPV